MADKRGTTVHVIRNVKSQKVHLLKRVFTSKEQGQELSYVEEHNYQAQN